MDGMMCVIIRTWEHAHARRIMLVLGSLMAVNCIYYSLLCLASKVKLKARRIDSAHIHIGHCGADT